MSGTEIHVPVLLSAEILATARAASAASRAARKVAVDRAIASALSGATGSRDGESREAAVHDARLTVLIEQGAGRLDLEFRRRVEAARQAGDERVVGNELDAAERAVDAAAGQQAVRTEVLCRFASRLPASLRPEVERLRPAPSGALRLEALRPGGQVLGVEVTTWEGDRAELVFDVRGAGLRPPAGALTDVCAHEVDAVEQLLEPLPAAGVTPLGLTRNGVAVSGTGRRRAADEAAKSSGV